MSITLQLEDVKKTYGAVEQPVSVLNGVSLKMSSGENLAILGPSGSGKSTLLHLIGTLDQPTSGTIHVNDQNPFSLSEPDLAQFRNKVVGFIFQDHHLLPQYDVLENVLIPALAFPATGNGAKARARELLDKVGLSHRIRHQPGELSGGESQRVAIARALINKPMLLLCDEPTGNLDSDTAQSVAELLFRLHREENNILIVVTHNLELASLFQRRMHLTHGRLMES